MAATVDTKKIVQLGKRLGELQLPSSKDALLKLLKQLSALLPNVDQSASEETRRALAPCKDALVRAELLHHKDKEVKLFVATCASEILRIEAPDLPYNDDVLKDLFELIVNTFKGLSDMQSPLYQKRVHILETVSAIKSCLLLLDIDNCDDVILDMFKTLFQEARDDHPSNILSAMLNIMALLVKDSDNYPRPLVMEIVSNLVKSKKTSAAASKVASEVIRENAQELEPNVIGLLNTVHEQSADPWLQQNYYEVLFEIHRCAPKMFLAYAPTIVEGLVNGDETIRVKTVELLGRVFSSQGQAVDKQLVSEFIKRITDKSLNVRVATMQSARDCFDSLGADAKEIIEKLEDRVQDTHDQGRMKAVTVICDIAKTNLESVPMKVLHTVADRLRDTKAGTRNLAMQKLTNVYATHCGTPESEKLEWIPIKILKCVNLKEFRPHGIELAFSEELFLPELPVSERTKHWIAMFSQFEGNDVKGLERVLSAKQRFQLEMKEYLHLRQDLKEENAPELEKKLQDRFKSMAETFDEKAEESLAKLHQMKDNSIFKRLLTLLEPSTPYSVSRSICDDLLSTIGVKHPQYEFLRLLAVRCSFLLFGREHVAAVLDEYETFKDSGNKNAVSSCMNLLLVFSRYFPELMDGVQDKIFNLLKDSEDDAVKNAALQIISRSGHCLREKIVDSRSSIDLTLETFCLEGTRELAKNAISAITALSSDAGLKALSVLYGHLLKAMESKAHLPTVLQSLGCIAQTAMPVFETRESDVVQYVLKDLLPRERSEDSTKSDWDSRSEECMLKIYGLKALIKSYLPNKDANLRQSSLKTIQPVLLNLLRFGSINEESKSSDIDKAHMRLAAAKAFLRLSRIWDKEIPAATSRFIMMTAQDPVFDVRQKFLLKTHQYLKLQRLPHKYAIVYPLYSVDSRKDIVQEAQRYMTDFIDNTRRNVARLKSSEGLNVHPEYHLTSLIHVLAHHPQFPDLSSSETAPYEPFYKQIYSYIHALLGQETDVKREENNLAAVLEIFRRIKNTEDANVPAATQNLYALCDIGLHIAKDLSKRSPEPYKGDVRLPSNLYKPVDEDSLKEDGSNMPSALTSTVLNRFRSSMPKGAQRGQKRAEGSDDDEDEDPLPRKSGSAETKKGKGKTPARKGKEKEAESMSEDDGDDAPKRKRGRPTKEKQQEDTPGQKKRGRPAKKQKVEVDSPATSADAKGQTPKSSAKKEKEKEKQKDDGASTTKRKKQASHKPGKSESEEKEPEPHLGRRVKVWWPDDKKYYRGVVKSYDAKRKRHHVSYDDGDRETLDMSKERWHYVDGKEKEDTSPSPPPREQAKAKKRTSEGSSQKKPKGKKRTRDSDDEHHQSENEKRPKVNGSNAAVVNGTAEAESSQRDALGDTDDDEPLDSYRRRMKKHDRQQQDKVAAAV
ncbi:sister chromatid cohesion protein PDS5 homolog A [Selaginella moellendorffii]|uniref:sister chromatid cohesion protein PDS5 homolog A n=1 Tax=Selaginella moellendorffii TaxID=88036 RepID=UPI000D1CCA8B|nr:sister chromatid cohesion protein PDS5 homolog A [Selaginella moellendorffii]|eukprot:XP_024520095.1 sister chromatid cohesion protein PDS5 homolog A [Selaginella moellendorffii]